MDLNRRTLLALFLGAPAIALTAVERRPPVPAPELPPTIAPRLAFPKAEVVEDALRCLGLLGAGEIACCDDHAYCGRVLDQLLAACRAPRSVRSQYPLAFQRAATWQLASEIAPGYLGISRFTPHPMLVNAREMAGKTATEFMLLGPV